MFKQRKLNKVYNDMNNIVLNVILKDRQKVFPDFIVDWNKVCKYIDDICNAHSRNTFFVAQVLLFLDNLRIEVFVNNRSDYFKEGLHYTPVPLYITHIHERLQGLYLVTFNYEKELVNKYLSCTAEEKNGFFRAAITGMINFLLKLKKEDYPKRAILIHADRKKEEMWNKATICMHVFHGWQKIKYLVFVPIKNKQVIVLYAAE